MTRLEVSAEEGALRAVWDAQQRHEDAAHEASRAARRAAVDPRLVAPVAAAPVLACQLGLRPSVVRALLRRGWLEEGRDSGLRITTRGARALRRLRAERGGA